MSTFSDWYENQSDSLKVPMDFLVEENLWTPDKENTEANKPLRAMLWEIQQGILRNANQQRENLEALDLLSVLYGVVSRERNQARTNHPGMPIEPWRMVRHRAGQIREVQNLRHHQGVALVWSIIDGRASRYRVVELGKPKRIKAPVSLVLDATELALDRADIWPL